MESFQSLESTDILRRVPMAKAIDLMRDAFVQLSERRATAPIRTVIEKGDKSGMALFMPSYSAVWGLYGIKMVSVFPGNSDIPVVQGKMLVMSALTGTPLAILDADAVTAIRTGAASGLATDLLASKDAAVLAIFGTGKQAWTQVEAVLEVRKIRKIIVRGSSGQKEELFCKGVWDKFHVPAKPMGTTDLREADVVCTATTSHNPLFDVGMLKPGAHINGIGSFKPDMREIGTDVIKACHLTVDQRDAALSEAGDIVIPINEGVISNDWIQAELGEIVSGKKPGRSSKDQITVFKSVGNAIQDLAIASWLVK